MSYPLNLAPPSPSALPSLSALAVLALLLTALACGPAEAADPASSTASATSTAGSEGDEPTASRPVVLLELFTSQGCSSCPPADRLLSQLADQGDIVALSFHVDYWNYIGWTDPFSSEEWSRRQRDYARVLRSDSVYTPQLVIDGRDHVVGSRPRDVDAALEQARQRAPAARVEVTDLRIEGNMLHANVSVDLQRSLSHGARLMVALAQDGLDTPVSAGENRSRTLHNDRVVRQLETVAMVEPGPGGAVRSEVSLAVAPDWPRKDLSLVAFVQDPQTLAVYGAAAARP